MEGSLKGAVVIVPFPFSDLSRSKKRPALVLAELDSNDIILCQITSQAVSDRHAIPVSDADFVSGSLKKKSNIRPGKIFTADRNLILYTAGLMKQPKFDEAINRTIEILNNSNQKWVF